MSERDNQQQLDQREMFAVLNPCIGVCTSGPKGYCKGCLRSRDERFYWQQMSDNQKHRVVQICQARKQRVAYARAKRALAANITNTIQVTDEQQLDLF